MAVNKEKPFFITTGGEQGFATKDEAVEFAKDQLTASTRNGYTSGAGYVVAQAISTVKPVSNATVTDL